jgi:uncharacterized protein YcnI/copper(I)-binding protein
MMKSIAARGLAASLLVSVTASTAFAHAGLENREATIGTTYKAIVKIPHGCDGAATTKVRVQVPNGLIAVKPMPKAGWALETVKGAYDKAYPYYGGKELNEGVTEVIWSGGSLPDAHYDEFTFTGLVAKNLSPDTTMYFPVLQDCETGNRNWVEIPAEGQNAHDLKSPAPRVRLVQTQHSGHGSQSASAAATYKIGPLVVEAPWARATPGGAKVGGGYLKITNTGSKPDRLTGGSVPFAKSVEVHEMAMTGDVMKMRRLENGLEIKPGETVELKPGGNHLMFMGLTAGLKDGQQVKGTLVFEKAGSVDVTYNVTPMGGAQPQGAAKGGHSHH